MTLTLDTLRGLLRQQLSVWPECAARYTALAGVAVRRLGPWTLQHNPARALSTLARVDAASIAARPCFLCRCHRPSIQAAAPLLGGRYELLVNPYPIFPLHFTIAATAHEPQSITAPGRLADMMALAAMMPGMAVFYNGPGAGASAPDHFHFQAVEAGCLEFLQSGFPYPVMEGVAPEADMCNAVAMGSRLVTIPRRAHRPQCYGESGHLVSPGAIDLCGTLILPRRHDFDTLTLPEATLIARDVTGR